MTLPNWMLSSTGEGISKRVKSAVVVIIAVVGYLGFSTNIDAETVGKFSGELFTAVIGLIGIANHIAGWVRTVEFKKKQLGKFAPNFRQ